MRLFVAVDLSDDVRQHAGDIARDVRREIERALPGAKASWVAPDNMHLTLHFLGEVAESQVGKVETGVAEPLAVPPFDVRIAGMGAFPPSGSARVLWLGVVEGGAGLEALYLELGRRLEPLGFRPESRRYTAHLTVARFRMPAPAASVRPILAGMADREAGRCAIDHVTLYESRLSPKGPTYIARVRGVLAT